jgi:hypothetical protein
MRMQRGLREAAPREFVEIGPEVAARMTLADEPAAATVAAYVLTRGASRAWEAINSHLAGGRGALFWIAGLAGAGKTHFLNYVLALSARAGALSAETARHLTLPLEIDRNPTAAEIERRILNLIGAALAGDHHAFGLWRQMRGAEALTIALDSARRQGVKGITIAIDLGLGESGAVLEILETMAQVARACKALRLIVVAAGRGEAPAAAPVFDVTPQVGEEIPVAVGRARRLDDSALRRIDGLYRDLDDCSWDTRAIYPLHPVAASALQSLRAPTDGVGILAMAVREVIEPWHADRNFNRLIVPAALMRSAVVRHAVNTRLGEAGRAAHKIATAAAAAIATDDGEREITRPLVDTLVLNHLSGPSPTLALGQIRARLGFANGNGAGGPDLSESLAALAERTRGVIVYDAQTYAAGFNPHGARSPEVAAFNGAVPLAICFDATLTEAQDQLELKPRLKRLADAMAVALEDACRNRDTLAAALNDGNAQLSLSQQQAFAGFIELAESGPTALIEVGANTITRAAALATIAAYDALALVAVAVPRLGLMRDYLAATNLKPGFDDAAGRDRNLVELETECQILAAAVMPAAIAGGGRNLDALEVRFQKFKWTYVQHYRAAHEYRRLDLEKLAPVADAARRHLEALRRLNAIGALGAPEGTMIGGKLAALEHQLLPCDSAVALAPEVNPCCAGCGLRLGEISPRDELNDLFESARRALEVKLIALSQRAIARLIRQHDLNHRLEGFLKIIQAAHTDALIAVLDDQLAGYLGRLLDENLGADTNGSNVTLGHAMAQNLRTPAVRRGKINGRNGRNLRGEKAPPDGD